MITKTEAHKEFALLNNSYKTHKTMKTVKAFLARDLDGSLCIYFNGKLRKHVNIWIIDLTKSNGRVNCAYLDKDLFPEVKWEDEEPTEVEIKIVDKQEQQPQGQH